MGYLPPQLFWTELLFIIRTSYNQLISDYPINEAQNFHIGRRRTKDETDEAYWIFGTDN